jgi:hypothetical protein
MTQKQKLAQEQASQHQQQQQRQQQAQQMQQKTQIGFSRHSTVTTMAIASLARQLGELAELEQNNKRRKMVRANCAEIIKCATEIATPEVLYITVPPDWEPPTMFEPCPNCSHMRSKQKKS